MEHQLGSIYSDLVTITDLVAQPRKIKRSEMPSSWVSKIRESRKQKQKKLARPKNALGYRDRLWYIVERKRISRIQGGYRITREECNAGAAKSDTNAHWNYVNLRRLCERPCLE